MRFRKTVVVGDHETGQLLSWKLEEARVRKVMVLPEPIACLAACPGQDHVVSTSLSGFSCLYLIASCLLALPAF